MEPQVAVERHIRHDWVTLKKECIEMRQEVERRYWDIGDRVAIVVEEYGAKKLNEFATETGMSASSLRRYKNVAAFYKDEERFLHLGLTFAHFAAAMRHNSPQQAREWLKKAAEEKMSSRDLEAAVVGGRGETVEEFYTVRMPKDTKAVEDNLHELLDKARSMDSSIPTDAIGKREWVMATMTKLLELADTNKAVRDLVLAVDGGGAG